MKVSTIFRISIFLLLSVIILSVGCAKKQRQFGTRYELENSFTMAFQNYGVYGATVDKDSNLMQVWVKGEHKGNVKPVYPTDEKVKKLKEALWL